MSSAPVKIDHPLYRLLQEENIQAFNAARAHGETIDLSNALLRGLNLRNMDARGLNMGGAYMKQADLRGIDFRESNLEGASICEANISGCYFPDELHPHEIFMSVELGTRLRYRRSHE